MGFNTFPCNPYPISTEELNKGNNDDLNARVATLEGDVSDLNSNKANQITIAPFFSAEASYDPGDLVYYNGLSYRCVNAHEGEWDADDFAATTVAGELDSVKSGLTNRRGISAYNLNVELAVFDGISSYGAYLNTVFASLQGYINNLPNGALIHIDRLNIGNISINNPSSRLGDKTTTVGSIFFANFVDFDIVNQSVVVRKVSMYSKTFEEIEGTTYTDYTNIVPEAGGALSVAVTVYELLS